MIALEKIMIRAAHSLTQGKRKAFCSNSPQSALSEAESFEWCSTYGEPGYDDPQRGIVFANWNHFPRELADTLERAGYAIEWSDEWAIVYETNKAYRTSPDCYSWTPYYVIDDGGETIGGDEIESGDKADWYVNEYLLNDPTRANVFKIDLTEYGFAQFNETFETGWHPGQNADPRAVFKQIRSQQPESDVVFSIESKGQFDARWTAWIRKSEGENSVR